MRTDFLRYDDGNSHELCIICREEGIERINENGMTLFRCRAGGHVGPRRIMIDPKMKWWVDGGAYWHESVGVFVRNRTGKFLFYTRALFPEDEVTVPSGHVDKGEVPERSAIRELREETRLKARRVRLIVTEEISGDRCRRGSDHHRWHAYLLVLAPSAAVSGMKLTAARVKLNDEGKGKRGEWLTLGEALERELTHPVAAPC